MQHWHQATLISSALLLGAGSGDVLAQTAISTDGAIESRSEGFEFPDDTVQTTAVSGISAPVEASGQQTCYDPTGTTVDVVACSGTGQDGELQAGLTWPTPRFTDNLDGTITDELTGLVWLQDTDCAALPSVTALSTALSSVHSLSSGACSLTDASTIGEWRLPNIKELLSLVDYGQANPGLPADHQFSNVGNGSFTTWSSTTYAFDRTAALTLVLSSGDFGVADKSGGISRRVMAVRGETGAPAPVGDTGQRICYNPLGTTTSCAGTGQDGERQAGADWPAPRFLDNFDGTVTDRLTGLVWLRDANCSDFAAPKTFEQSLALADLLSSGLCNLVDDSLAGDWRVPTIKELLSLIHHDRSSPALPSEHPFLNVLTLNNSYWSSTTFLQDRTEAWVFAVLVGLSRTEEKDTTQYLWPVRDP